MSSVPATLKAMSRLDPWHEMRYGVTKPELHDLRLPGSTTVKHAGSDDFEHRAALLYDDSESGMAFIVQLRLGPVDPIDLDGPAGWCVWQIGIDASTTLAYTVPSWLISYGEDMSVNHLGAPNLNRGGGAGWGTGTTPELRWLSGKETGRRLQVAFAADGLSGTVGWEDVPTSWTANPIFDDAILASRPDR